MLFFYLGIVLATPIVGNLIRRWGSKVTTFAGAFFYCLSLPLIGINYGIPFLGFSMFAFGLSQGILDVSMNTQGIVAEIIAKIPIIGSFHGSYSISAAIGSFVGTGLSLGGFSAFYSFCIAGVTCFILNPFAASCLYCHHEEREIVGKANSISVTDQKEGSFIIPTGPFAYLCASGFLASFGEGGIVTWSTIYFKRVLNAEAPYSSMGFFALMISMGTGRYCCDKLREYFGAKRVLRMGGLLACAGKKDIHTYIRR